MSHSPIEMELRLFEGEFEEGDDPRVAVYSPHVRSVTLAAVGDMAPDENRVPVLVHVLGCEHPLAVEGTYDEIRALWRSALQGRDGALH